MEPCIYAGETEKIIAHAMHELGLEYSYLKERASLPHGAVGHLKSKHISVTQWVNICSLLFIPTDSIGRWEIDFTTEGSGNSKSVLRTTIPDY